MNNSKHIGIFNDSFPPIIDGVTLAVENYVKWLSRFNMNPCVVTPWNPQKIACDCDVLRYFSLPIRSRHPYRYGYPKLDPLIWIKLRRTPFLLVHSHCPFSSGRLAVYVKKHQHVPLIGTFHSKYKQDLIHSFRHTPWMVSIIMKRILNFFEACDEVWIPQKSVEETVREYGYKGRLTVVDNGIDYAALDDSDIENTKSSARERLGIADNEISLLFVGQHIWEKGVKIIIGTLSRLKDKIPFKMNFVGNGYALGDMKSMVRNLGLEDKVTFRGLVSNREQLKEYYAAADLFLFPSLYDNAPLVVREAASLATPAIIPIGSTASEVIADGGNGFLSEPTEEAYTSLISNLYADRAKIREVGLNAKHTLCRSWHDVVEEVADRYRVILKQYK